MKFLKNCLFNILLLMTTSLFIQIVCVPFNWRVNLFLIILVNAAVSVLVEVRHTR